jgi:hypothetical protein
MPSPKSGEGVFQDWLNDTGTTWTPTPGATAKYPNEIGKAIDRRRSEFGVNANGSQHSGPPPGHDEPYRGKSASESLKAKPRRR